MVTDYSSSLVRDTHERDSNTLSGRCGRKRGHTGDWSLYEDTVSTDDSNDELAVVPFSKGNNLACERRKTLWEDDSSDDGSTCCVSQRYKRAKRVHNYNGWLEFSTLKTVAEKYGGAAYQFRVVRGFSYVNDSINNEVIPPGSLVVQRRFVTAAGNAGVHNYRFLAWKLPGTTNRHSMYKDARPWFHNASTPFNAFPSISLDSALSAAVQTIVSTFLEDAEPGMTPIDFFGKGEGRELLAPVHDRCDIPMAEVEVHVGNNSFSPPESNKLFAVGYRRKNCVHKSLPQDQTLQQNGEKIVDACAYNYSGVQHDGGATGKALGTCTNNNNCEGIATKPSSWCHLVQPSVTKKRKRNQGPKPQNPNDVCFVVKNSNSNQCIVLVEGFIYPPQSTTTNSHDSWPDIILDGHVESLPRRGRLVEFLPNVALPGPWLASIIGAEGTRRSASGFTCSAMGDLNAKRIALRHESVFDLGMLDDSMTTSPRRGSSSRGVNVSRINPSLGSCMDFDHHGLVKGHEPRVVGTISIVVGENCASSLEEDRERAGKLATELLAASQAKIVELTAKGVLRSADLESLLPIPDKEDEGGRSNVSNVGMTFLCEFASKMSYYIFVGQDDEGMVVAIDRRSPTNRASRLTVANNPQLPDQLNVSPEENGILVDDAESDIGAVPSTDASVVSFGDNVFEEKDGVHLVSAEKASQNTLVIPSPNAPKVAIRGDQVMSGEPSPTVTLQTLPFVTPCASRFRQPFRCEEPPIHRSSISSGEQVEYPVKFGLADCVEGGISTSKSGPGPRKKDFIPAFLGRIPIVVLNPVTRAKLRWKTFDSLLIAAILFAFCLRLPKDVPEPVQGHANRVDISAIAPDWLAEFDSLFPPVGYSIIRSEWVSVSAIVVIAVVFGRT